jgi:predicted amidohydrolase
MRALVFAILSVGLITACSSSESKPNTDSSTGQAAAAPSVTPVKANTSEYDFPTDKIQPIEEVFEPKGKYDSKKFLKVAAVQRLPKEDALLTWTADQAEAFKQKNREALKKEILQAVAHGAKIIVLPEFAVTGYPDIPNVSPEDNNFRNRDDLKNFVEKIPGPSSEFFSKISKKNHVWIQYGLAEVDPKDDGYYNAAVVVGPKGTIVAHYRKQNLFGIEDKALKPGTENQTFITPAGKVGVVICADTYKESVLEKYKEMKVDVLLNSSAWARYNSAIYHWTKAAQKVGAYLVSSNDAYAPDVAIQNPDGTIQAHARQTPNVIVYGYIPLKKIE